MDDNDNPLAGVIDDSNPPSDDVLSNDKEAHTTNTTMLQQDEGDADEGVKK